MSALPFPKQAMSMPTEAIQLLLDMVRGIIPFKLVPAIQAALQIAEYITGLFDEKALSMSPTAELTLESALAMMAEQPHVEAINISLLTYILKLVMQWISEQVK